MSEHDAIEPTAPSPVTIGRCIACGHPLVSPTCAECGAHEANARWLALGIDPAGAALVARRLGSALIATRIGLLACFGPALVGLLVWVGSFLVPTSADELANLAPVVAFYGTLMALPLQLAWIAQIALLGRALRAAESAGGGVGADWHGPAAQVAGFMGVVLLLLGFVASPTYEGTMFLLTLAALPLMLDAVLRALRRPPLAVAIRSRRLVGIARLAAHLAWLAVGTAGLGLLGITMVFGATGERQAATVAIVAVLVVASIELVGLVALSGARRDLRR